jgi:para-aminobenzoate synthetase
MHNTMKIPSQPSLPIKLCMSQNKFDLQVVLIDHYDSYTYNLYDLLKNLCSYPPIVLTKDFDGPLPANCDALVLSPGPGRPSCQGDMGRTLEIIESCTKIPILGVCLGHQALAYVHGATVKECPTPVHGQVHTIDLIQHDGSDDFTSALWKGLPKRVPVTRYHSLGVYDLPDCLEVLATYQNNLVMALRHRTLPHFGVQFHPESIGTPQGEQMLSNFLSFCQENANRRGRISNQPRKWSSSSTMFGVTERMRASAPNVYYISSRQLRNVTATCEQVFQHFYGNSTDCIWLDSSSRDSSSSKEQDSMTRYSILAGRTGPLSRRIEYFGFDHEYSKQGIFVIDQDESCTRHSAMTIMEYFKSFQNFTLKYNFEKDSKLPFVGGHLGYLGYEVRYDTQAQMDKNAILPSSRYTSKKSSQNIPTASFLFVDQCLVYDHAHGVWHIIEIGKDNVTASRWIETTAEKLVALSPQPSSFTFSMDKKEGKKFHLQRSKSRYYQDIIQCLEYIRLGESYELCLTNQWEAVVPRFQDPFILYQILRRHNPAPFAAYLKFQFLGDSSLPCTICCSSPERFVSVKKSNSPEMNQDTELMPRSKWIVEAKPIKGTSARELDQPEKDDAISRDLKACIKNRAENLMIVDLLRNDLNRVCRNVTVPRLMEIESFASVHQMVSTIRGELECEKTYLDVLSSCFPGGSMTGAPKRRTMDLLHHLEDEIPRGPYSGCLGYISLDGTMDMNIVIRSIVVTPHSNESWKLKIGAGGAITALSEPQSEYREMVLKGKALKEAVSFWLS